MNRLVRLSLVTALTVALVSACAAPGAERPAASSKAEGTADYAPPPPAPQAGAPAQPGYPESPSPGTRPVAPQATAPGQDSPSPNPGRSARLKAFYQSTVSLDMAGADCQTACRALEAMDRTAGELCEIDGKDGICKDAEGRVRDARDRVRNACGTCRDGTVLDRNAPVPSRK